MAGRLEIDDFLESGEKHDISLSFHLGVSIECLLADRRRTWMEPGPSHKPVAATLFPEELEWEWSCRPH